MPLLGFDAAREPGRVADAPRVEGRAGGLRQIASDKEHE